MGLQVISGFEIYVSTTEVDTGPDGKAVVSNASAVRETSVVHTDNASLLIQPSTSAGYGYNQWLLPLDHDTAYVSFWFRTSIPTQDFSLFRILDVSSNPKAEVRVRTTGKPLAYLYKGGQWTSSSDQAQSIVADKWHHLTVAVSSTITPYLDGSFIGGVPGPPDFTGNPRICQIGYVTSPGDTDVIYIDDIVITSNIGTPNQGYGQQEARVALLKPISDAQDGSWRGGADTTGINLFDAVNNTPPIGTASETDTTQIESVDNSGDNSTDEYRVNLATPESVIGTTSTIDIIQAWINHGEDVNTNTKTGSFGHQSNPSDSYATFTYGDDAGALGTWPTNWKWKSAPAINQPTITKDQSSVLAVRKTDSGTRVASVDFLGAYVVFLKGIPNVNRPMFIP